MTAAYRDDTEPLRGLALRPGMHGGHLGSVGEAEGHDPQLKARQNAGVAALIKLGQAPVSVSPSSTMRELPAVQRGGITDAACSVADRAEVLSTGFVPSDYPVRNLELVQRRSRRGRSRNQLVVMSGVLATLAVLYGVLHLSSMRGLMSLSLLVQVSGISVVGLRLTSYFHSFIFHWRSYRCRENVSTTELKQLDVPYVRLHVTTRGLPGSTEVILRGIRNVAALVAEDVDFYGELLGVEICTESEQQARIFLEEFDRSALSVRTLVVPEHYQTAAGTLKKARSLQYMVEHRRAGWGRRPGRTFVVHYDEESVIEPTEMRKLLRCLATTEKKILEGPIYYPLEYTGASLICRAMEANRPIGCFECRSVMESGIPLHLHGSNLVVEEEFENEIGWDMGQLDGQPFIAEDYVFGALVS
jgi:hypothetical protein